MSQQVKSEPYHYKEQYMVATSTTENHKDLKRYPDMVILQSDDATNNIYIAFDEVVTTSNAMIVTKTSPLVVPLRCRTIHFKSSAGTPNLFILALAYRDERIKD